MNNIIVDKIKQNDLTSLTFVSICDKTYLHQDLECDLK